MVAAGPLMNSTGRPADCCHVVHEGGGQEDGFVLVQGLCAVHQLAPSFRGDDVIMPAAAQAADQADYVIRDRAGI